MARETKSTAKQPTLPELTTKFTYFPFLNQKLAAILIGIIGFTFYITSINGEYALDDGIFIHSSKVNMHWHVSYWMELNIFRNSSNNLFA